MIWLQPGVVCGFHVEKYLQLFDFCVLIFFQIFQRSHEILYNGRGRKMPHEKSVKKQKPSNPTSTS